MSIQVQAGSESEIVGTLFRASSDMILMIGEKGEKLVLGNSRALKTFGYSGTSLASLTADQFFVDAESVKAFFSSIWNRRHGFQHRAVCRHKSGRPISVTISGSMVTYRGNPCALAIIREATDDKLERVNRKGALLALLNAVKNLPHEVRTMQQDIQFWLRQICRGAQLPAAHAHLVSAELVERVECADLWHVESGGPLRRSPGCTGFLKGLYSRVADTRTHELIANLEGMHQFGRLELGALNLKSAFAVPVIVEGGVAAISVFFSAAPSGENELLVELVETLARELGYMIQHRMLSSRMMKMQDEERRRLARELHDTTAQSMSMLILELQTIREETSGLSVKARRALSQSLTFARQSLREIRTFSYLLHPPMIEELGLISALRIFIDGFSRRSGIRVSRELPASIPRMTAEWEMALFYAVQEGLTNVQRHAHSGTAEVHLVLEPHIAVLRVENVGRLVPRVSGGELPEPSIGVGIAGMRERVHIFGGEVHLYSQENRTILQVKLPMRKASAASAGAS